MKTAQLVLPSPSISHDLTALTSISPQLVLAFADPEWFSTPDLLGAIQEALRPATLVGCSTAGEVAGSGVIEGSCVLTAIHFDDPGFAVTTTPILDMADSLAAGQRVGDSLTSVSPHSVLIFGPGVDINGSALVNGIASRLPPGTSLAGGLAGDAGAFSQTWTIGPRGIHAREIVAIGFHSPAIQVSHGCYGGWATFGPARRVTRCKENVLFELDGERALDVYKRYLGDYAKDLPAAGLLFPFGMLDSDRDDVGLIRTILGISEEDGSLTLAGEIDPTGYLRLMHASTDRLVDGAEEAARAVLSEDNGADGLAILVSCVGRKLVMGDRVDEEVEAVALALGPQTCLGGFYSYGEIAPFAKGGDCSLHNQTMTITRLRETP